MAKIRYYFYDHEACTFVEAKPSRNKLLLQLGLMFAVALAFVLVLAWVFSDRFGTPRELALREENRVLQAQMSETLDRMKDFSNRLEILAQTDEELYRTILQEDPIAEEVRQVGIGGSDDYEEFRRFSSDTRTLLRSSAETLDKLVRQMDLQSRSFRSLMSKAEARTEAIKEMPSIRPSEGRLVSGFGIRLHPIDRIRKMHHGIDFVMPTGNDIFVTGDGTVSFTGRRGGYGITVEVTHPKSGYMTRYTHLSKILVRKGQRVSRGDVIGLSGNTGRSVAPHLHYEVRDTRGNSLNPIDFFAPSMTPQAYLQLVEEADRTVTTMD
jgi:murein DD-endopeptidase MepM/ murein hydrolase activator NlpD